MNMDLVKVSLAVALTESMKAMVTAMAEAGNCRNDSALAKLGEAEARERLAHCNTPEGIIDANIYHERAREHMKHCSQGVRASNAIACAAELKAHEATVAVLAYEVCLAEIRLSDVHELPSDAAAKVAISNAKGDLEGANDSRLKTKDVLSDCLAYHAEFLD